MTSRQWPKKPEISADSAAMTDRLHMDPHVKDICGIGSTDYDWKFVFGQLVLATNNYGVMDLEEKNVSYKKLLGEQIFYSVMSPGEIKVLPQNVRNSRPDNDSTNNLFKSPIEAARRGSYLNFTKHHFDCKCYMVRLPTNDCEHIFMDSFPQALRREVGA